jgi:hypothetical protein
VCVKAVNDPNLPASVHTRSDGHPGALVVPGLLVGFCRRSNLKCWQVPLSDLSVPRTGSEPARACAAPHSGSRVTTRSRRGDRGRGRAMPEVHGTGTEDGAHRASA